VKEKKSIDAFKIAINVLCLDRLFNPVNRSCMTLGGNPASFFPKRFLNFIIPVIQGAG
jgi:hypothetical protein